MMRALFLLALFLFPVLFPTGACADGNAWLGTWHRTEATVTITSGAKPGTLHIDGEASWGSGDPDRVARGGVNMGEISADVTPSGNRLGFTLHGEDVLAYGAGDAMDCRVEMHRMPVNLVVKDNGYCGGHNVSFTGAYTRTKK